MLAVNPSCSFPTDALTILHHGRQLLGIDILGERSCQGGTNKTSALAPILTVRSPTFLAS